MIRTSSFISRCPCPLGLGSVFLLRLVFLRRSFLKHAAVEWCKLWGAQGPLFPSQHPHLSTSSGRPCEKPARRFGSLACRLLVWVIAQRKNDGPGVSWQLSDQCRIQMIHSTVKAKRLQTSFCSIGYFSKAFPKDLSSDSASPGNPTAYCERQSTRSVTVLEKHSGHSKRPFKSKRISKNG